MSGAKHICLERIGEGRYEARDVTNGHQRCGTVLGRHGLWIVENGAGKMIGKERTLRNAAQLLEEDRKN